VRRQRAIQIPRTKSNVNSDGADDCTSSAARKNLNAAANSRKPMTTLTELSQEPLLGILRSNVGKRAKKKNGDAKVTENAKPPRILCHQGRGTVPAVPPKPPKNGATQAKLMIVKVRAMKMVPTMPPLPSFEDVNLANPLGNSMSYMPNKLRAKNTNRAPRP